MSGSTALVTVGADGLALISYYDETNRDLKVAHCSNLFRVTTAAAEWLSLKRSLSPKRRR